MRDGLYRVQFSTQAGHGAGVVVLSGGQLRGGDGALYYVGTYTIEGDQFSATIETNRHTADANIRSVLGVDRAHITLQGTITGDSASMNGTAQEAPGVQFQATLSHLSD